jgi:hypothetical protein
VDNFDYKKQQEFMQYPQSIKQQQKQQYAQPLYSIVKNFIMLTQVSPGVSI